MNLERYCVGENFTIKEVLERFENCNDRVAIVRNRSQKVIGVVSQGDILRALSSGMNLYVPINRIIQNSFLYLQEKNLEQAYYIFKKTLISLLPIINDSGELIDVIKVSDIYEYLENLNGGIY